MDSPHGAAVTAEDLGLKGPRGWAFRSVSIKAEPGSLVAIEGPSGSGRTCLLLALTGRMRPTEGSAEVGGLPLPRKMAAVRRISALGPVPGVSELDPALTVAEHLRERAWLQRRFDGSLRALLRPRAERIAAARSRIDTALEAAGLDVAALPKQERTSVRDLERLEALRLYVALALIGRPGLLAVDDTDLKLSDVDRAEAWQLLRSVAEAGTTVLAVCSQAPEGRTAIRTITVENTSTVESTSTAEETETAENTGTAESTETAENTGTADNTESTEDTTESTTDDEEGTADAIAETRRA
ncbi:ATP-binding cassette domain-containing protein [Streptomyces sp. V1I1]|uniref:ATP-binding cassette domain-containing protein n=1 Tax=Streptomyces sp. V1I1 TaxID=3042272 RepID=UPI002783ECAB|nr:ATP-binding cassette domain-containing protein [Streptomyces sp. V1I1]MDQ0944129.1 ABC-2 type transport system ATP-binding protein [Streptomyces sp. V1I1]